MESNIYRTQVQVYKMNKLLAAMTINALIGYKMGSPDVIIGLHFDVGKDYPINAAHCLR